MNSLPDTQSIGPERLINGNARAFDEANMIVQEYPDDYKPTVISRLSAADEPVLIERKIVSTPYIPRHPSQDYLIFTCSQNGNTVRLHYLETQLTLDINHDRYYINPASAEQILVIRTGSGQDRVTIDDQVKNLVIVETADGDDAIHSEGAKVRIHAGAGDDFITTGAGEAYIAAGKGNDMVFVEGSATVYGGEGNDHISATASQATHRHLLDGGQGNDQLIGGQGHSILSGNDGDDHLLAGIGTNTIYTGAGRDTVMLIKPTDKVIGDDRHDQFFQATPQLPANAEALRLAPSDQGDWRLALHAEPHLDQIGIVVTGPSEFQERVNDDLRLLGSSPRGSQLLSVLNETARKHGIAVEINPLEYERNALFLEFQGAGNPYVRDGKAGDPLPGGSIHYNPAIEVDATPGVVLLYHELCHAYNRVTGTVFPGDGFDGLRDEKSTRRVPNEELQAVGLPAQVTPFDFDGDPTTPPLDTNPMPFAENGLREELGLAPRTRVSHS